MVAFRVVAVDLDGTFLNRKHSFDAPRFWKLFDRMQARGCRFVVASGNQYENLRAPFGARADELSYIAENGALIVGPGGERLVWSTFSKEAAGRLLKTVQRLPVLPIVCGLRSAYLPANVDERFFQIMQIYYPKLQKCDSFEGLDDEILKFSLAVPQEQTWEYAARIRDAVGEDCDVTSSGHGCVDLIQPGLHKAAALEQLLARWQLPASALLAFGDGENDAEMLRIAGAGYVMENGSPAMLAEFPLHAPPNEESGVLQVLETIFPA